jgi:DNA polymerase III epsilon subunit-like protein
MSLYKIRIGSYGLVLLPESASHPFRRTLQHAREAAAAAAHKLYVFQEVCSSGGRFSECVVLHPKELQEYKLAVDVPTSPHASASHQNQPHLYDALIGDVTSVESVPANLPDTCVMVLPATTPTQQPLQETPNLPPKLPRIDTVEAKCPASMDWLDGVHRAYVTRHKFGKRSLAFKAVAGSGKTTILMNLVHLFQKEKTENPSAVGTKKIAYVAFNKQLVDEFRAKCVKNGVQQVVTPFTFDALVYRVARDRHEQANGVCVPFEFHGAMNPSLLTDKYKWFRGKSHRLKKRYVDLFAKFCQSPSQTDPTDKWVRQFWNDTRNGTLVTFDGLRKLAYTEHWLRGYMDAAFSRVLVDEAQDLDPIMLNILSNDVDAPKVFVGDPHQQIYEWRGTVNAFERLPPRTIQLNLYKTFRMGEPATSEVSHMTGVQMISGIPDTSTAVTTGVTHARLHGSSCTTPPPPYTYVHRTWKSLLQEAQAIAHLLNRYPHAADPRIWIVDYQSQMRQVRALHEKIQRFGACAGACQPDGDDLPAFLTKLSVQELQSMCSMIESKLTSDPSKAVCRMYTAHRFKGLEDDIVRVANDLHRVKDQNLVYVSFTRAQKHLWVDEGLSTYALGALTTTYSTTTTTQTAHSIPTGTQERCMNESRPFCTGSETASLHIASVTSLASPKSSPLSPATEPATDHEGDTTLDGALKEYRRAASVKRGVPAFCVFGNRTLAELGRIRPTTREELLRVHGIGKQKLEHYGKDIIGICQQHTTTATTSACDQNTTPPTSQLSQMPSPPSIEHEEDAKVALPSTVPSGICKHIRTGRKVDLRDYLFTERPPTPSRNTPISGPSSQQQQQQHHPPAQPSPMKSDHTKDKVPSCSGSSSSSSSSSSSDVQCKRTRTRTTSANKLLLCYDIETTGFRPNADKLIQISVQMIWYNPHPEAAAHDPASSDTTSSTASHTFTLLDTHTSFVDPGRPIPRRVVDITGITNEDVVSAPSYSEVHETLRQKVHRVCRAHQIRTCVWIAHNGTRFDHKFLKHNSSMLRRSSLVDVDMVEDLGEVSFEFVDTLTVANECWKHLPDAPQNFKLQTLYDWCRIRCPDAAVHLTLTPSFSVATACVAPVDRDAHGGGVSSPSSPESTTDAAPPNPFLSDSDNDDCLPDSPLRFHRADDDVKAMVVIIRTLAQEHYARRRLLGCG